MRPTKYNAANNMVTWTPLKSLTLRKIRLKQVGSTNFAAD